MPRTSGGKVHEPGFRTTAILMLACHFAIFGVTMVPCHAEKARHRKATGEESTKLSFSNHRGIFTSNRQAGRGNMKKAKSKLIFARKVDNQTIKKPEIHLEPSKESTQGVNVQPLPLLSFARTLLAHDSHLQKFAVLRSTPGVKQCKAQ
jgi:hypothetical protein